MDYNSTVSAVDKSDQNLSYYPCARNGQKMYDKKVFRHLLDMAIYNAFGVYQKSGDSTPTLSSGSSCWKHSSNRTDLQSRPSRPSRLTERHFPDYLPLTEEKESPTRRRVVCTKEKKDLQRNKVSRLWCPAVCHTMLPYLPHQDKLLALKDKSEPEVCEQIKL